MNITFSVGPVKEDHAASWWKLQSGTSDSPTCLRVLMEEQQCPLVDELNQHAFADSTTMFLYAHELQFGNNYSLSTTNRLLDKCRGSFKQDTNPQNA